MKKFSVDFNKLNQRYEFDLRYEFDATLGPVRLSTLIRVCRTIISTSERKEGKEHGRDRKY